jgi:hypothetical protein
VDPTAIYSPFFQNSQLCYRRSESLSSYLSLATGSGSHHLHSHIPWATIRTQPWESIFLTSHPGTHAHVQNYQITVIQSLSSDIVHVGYLVLMCVDTWSSPISTALSGI